MRRPPQGALLLVVAVRPGAVAETRARRCGTLCGPAGGGARGRGPLGRSAADLLARADRTPEERARIFESSGGNPLLLVELSRRSATSDALRSSIVAAVSRDVAAPGGGRRCSWCAPGRCWATPSITDIAAATAELHRRRAPATMPSTSCCGADWCIPAAAKELTFRSSRDPLSGLRREPSRSSYGCATMPGPPRSCQSPGESLPSQARHLAHVARPGDLKSAATLRRAAAGAGARAHPCHRRRLDARREARGATRRDVVSSPTWPRCWCSAGRLDEALTCAEEGLLFGRGSAGDEDRVRLVAGGRRSVERLLGSSRRCSRRRLLRAVAELSVVRPAVRRGRCCPGPLGLRAR